MKKIPLIGEINEQMFQYLFTHSHTVREQPIELILCTHGGDIYTALGMYEYIRKLPVQVIVKVYGPCFSSGMIILQAGDERIGTKNSQFMIHYGQDSSSCLNDLKQINKITKLYGDVLIERSNHTRKKLDSWFNTETFFSGQQALEAGLIDKYEQ